MITRQPMQLIESYPQEVGDRAETQKEEGVNRIPRQYPSCFLNKIIAQTSTTSFIAGVGQFLA
jgi:hypothetical protein